MSEYRDITWTIADASDLYNLSRWGCDFFHINDQGQLIVRTGPDAKPTAIADVVSAAAAENLEPPFIVRFPEIIKRRVIQINYAFAGAIKRFNYTGSYRCFYPTKVNQHREVIQAVIDAGRPFGGGVEAGSKAELFAMLLMSDNEVPILCNGFKDASMVEMAFRARQIGRDVTIILEKPSELDLVLDCFQRIGVRPKLGVRVKLAARSGGRWNASGGTKSKFGLTVYQLTQVVRRLKQLGMVDCLQLLHFHPGSQISTIRKIKASLIEAARIYADLCHNGVPLKTIDVGGGLAVDYTGEASISPSSKNYELEEYANDVVYYIQQVCAQAGVAEPDIVSESGRAITAHHSLIVVPILNNHEQSAPEIAIDPKFLEKAPVLKELSGILDFVDSSNLSESFHDAQTAIETVWQLFAHGSLSLEQRSCAEQLADKIYRSVASKLDELDFVPGELDDLRHQLADTCIANFSVFQALPDSWALDQVFPMVPIQRLNERPSRRAVIGDITCDSDGQINCFVGSAGGKSLPLHDVGSDPYCVGIFLVGAYQEALSDDHNLMGKYHVLVVDADGSIDMRTGATTSDVLEQVHHTRPILLNSLDEGLQTAIERSLINEHEKTEIAAFMESILESYTYLASHHESKPQEELCLSHSSR